MPVTEKTGTLKTEVFPKRISFVTGKPGVDGQVELYFANQVSVDGVVVSTNDPKRMYSATFARVRELTIPVVNGANTVNVPCAVLLKALRQLFEMLHDEAVAPAAPITPPTP